MAFLSLANEIIIQIVEYLDNQRDINSVSQVNRRFHNLFDDYLIRYNIQFRRSSALLWAVKHGRESTARKLLHLGADVDAKLQKTSARPERLGQSNSDHCKAHLGVTALHVAAWKGHLPIVKILLEVGSDPEARSPSGKTPMYAALVAGHEKISRTISRYISNLQNCLVDSEEGLTPLHVASQFGLSKSVRLFLEGGADIHAIDRKGRTPLHHALITKYEVLELDNNSTRYNLRNIEGVPSSDEVFGTVMVLREFGADPDFETPVVSIWSKPARELGARHPYKRVRELFESDTNTSLHRPYDLHIGRMWMLPSISGIRGREADGPEPRTCFNNPLASRNQSNLHAPGISALSGRSPDELQWQPDVGSFPSLNTATSDITNLHTHPPDGPWSLSSINSLKKGFSVINELEIQPAPELPRQVDPFPQLSNNSTDNLLGTTARNLWADFGKPKRHPIVEDALTISTSGGEDSVLGLKHTRVRSKRRWQPLKL